MQYSGPNSIPCNRQRDVILSTASKSTGCVLSQKSYMGSRWPKELYTQYQGSEQEAPRPGGATGKRGGGASKKAAILIGCLSLSPLANAQTPYEIVEVVTLDSTRTASEIYRTAERWFVSTFSGDGEGVQQRDSLSHILVGKGIKPCVFFKEGVAMIIQNRTVTYLVELEAKQGRYRARVHTVEVDDIIPVNTQACCYGDCTWPGTGKKMRENFVKAQMGMCDQIHAYAEAVIPSLKAYLANPPKQDW